MTSKRSLLPPFPVDSFDFDVTVALSALSDNFARRADVDGIHNTERAVTYM